MDADTTRRVRSLFDAALELPEAARPHYLDTACGSDVELRRRVEVLLAAASNADSFLETPAFASDPTLLNLPDPKSLLGTTIGRYRLIEVIAEGGMGVVYKAEQESPARLVALKVLRWALEDQEAVDRFHYEVECLGKLRHPGIAQIIEAGVHSSGPEDDAARLPYFAMEYVPDAKPLTTYINESNLTLRERIELLIEVCEAVHHGHVNGVIHCDLKPANILVDGAGRVRVIDFGISRTLEHESKGGGEATGAGTAQYMSPEQCMPGAVVDTRSDVYSLGVVLYEVLCEAMPHDLSGKRISEVAQVITQEPAVEPKFRAPGLPLDLQAVLLRALAKAPAERYASASELESDLKRYLAHEPVAARLAGPIHQLRLMARRHRAGVVAVVLIGVLLATSAVGAGYLTSRLYEQKDAAAAKTRLAKAFGDFVRDLIDSADPRSGDRATLTVGDTLKKSYDEVEDRFATDPTVAAQLHSVIGAVLHSVSDFSGASAHLNRAWELHVQQHTEETSEGAWTLAYLAMLNQTIGPAEEAFNQIDQAISTSRQVGDEAANVLQTVWSAMILRRMGKPDEALARLDNVQKRGPVREDSRVACQYWSARATCLHDLNRDEEAIEAANMAIELAQQRYGQNSTYVAGNYYNLANMYSGISQFETALASLRRGEEIFRQIEGDDSPQLLFVGITEAMLLSKLDRMDEAQVIGLHSYEEIKAKYGPDDRRALQMLHNLAQLYRSAGRLDEAASAYEAARAGFARTLGPDSPEVITAEVQQSSVFALQGKHAEAAATYLDLISRATRAKGPNCEVALGSQVRRLYALLELNQRDQALLEGEAAWANWPDTIGWKSQWTVELAKAMEKIYESVGRPEDAARVRATRESATSSDGGK